MASDQCWYDSINNYLFHNVSFFYISRYWVCVSYLQPWVAELISYWYNNSKFIFMFEGYGQIFTFVTNNKLVFLYHDIWHPIFIFRHDSLHWHCHLLPVPAVYRDPVAGKGCVLCLLPGGHLVSGLLMGVSHCLLPQWACWAPL